MNQRALYYPYIHIRDVHWLKATLLLFSDVRRMVPMPTTPDDSDEIKQFVGANLLLPADLWTRRSEVAQETLARRLLADAKNDPSFLAKYGRAATFTERFHHDAGGHYGFQIHQLKLNSELRDALRSTGLAWNPFNREVYDHDGEYLEVHPRVGEAVMSTLAVAVATGEGLDIVGDHRSGRLHDCLVNKDADQIYDAWLHPPELLAAPRPTTGEDVLEFLVGLSCDVSALTPAKLAGLQQEREPLRNLIDRLRTLASDIPAMDPGRKRDSHLRDVASTILEQWRADRSNMPSYWRAFFGDKLGETSQKFVEKVAETLTSSGEKAATGGVTGAGVAAVGGGGAGALVAGAVTGAGVGLAIGLVFHAARSYYRMRKTDRESPYRYLTLMERAGVVFRGDLGASHALTPVDAP